MMSSACVWGYWADTIGRRPLLLYGLILDALCNFLISTSQSFYVLLTFKFFSGFIVNGPFAINMTFVAEYHSEKYRSRALLLIGLFNASAQFVLPCVAWIVIPQGWSFELLDGAFVYNSWRLFLFLSGLPCFIASLTVLYFPESPKFLMTQGKNEEALKVFRWMYSLNTGNPPEMFPVKVLRQEDFAKKLNDNKLRNPNFWQKTYNRLVQMSLLFRKPYFKSFMLIAVLQFGSILGLNTLRLWLPQLFTVMENYQSMQSDPEVGSGTFCDAVNNMTSLSNNRVNDANTSDICVPVPVPDAVYINSLIVSATSVILYLLSSVAINKISRKILMMISFFFSSLGFFVFYLSPNSDVVLALSALTVSFSNITTLTITSILVELMPTSLRTLAISLVMMIGRLGAVSGNLVFPILLNLGCYVPFSTIGGYLALCLLIAIFIPKPSGILV
ncbi:synaptic vesicle glycoprotein 2B-like isoform X2 [Cephus cinctus]|nr:synaptic vesicle glycoprotein 2B-like isoform X2 [Cephus cinctus]